MRLHLVSYLINLTGLRQTDRGSKVLDESNRLFHKFMEQVENIFKNLPNSLKLRLFYENDLQILMDTSEDVRIAAIDHNLKPRPKHFGQLYMLPSDYSLIASSLFSYCHF